MKIEAIRSRLDKAGQGTAIGPFEIDLGAIRTDPTMQVRDRLNDQNKQRLRSAYKAGADVPPLLVALVDGDDGGPVVIDGHHRFNVLETLQAEGHLRGGKPINTVQAKFVKLTREEARYQAAKANSTHGLQLTQKESRRVFATYVLAGQHTRGDGSFKSYREIGRDMSKYHKTIASWMRADFPGEAAQMEKPEKATEGGDGAPPPGPTVLVKHEIEATMLELRNLFERARSTDRQVIIDSLECLLVGCKAVAAQTSAWLHDDALDALRQARGLAERCPEEDF